MSIVIGWDIGGVHLKAARAESGRIVKAVQLAAPLRGGVERLAEAFTLAKAELGAAQLLGRGRDNSTGIHQRGGGVKALIDPVLPSGQPRKFPDLKRDILMHTADSDHIHLNLQV